MAKNKNKKSRARKRFEKKRDELRLFKGDNMSSLLGDSNAILDPKYAVENYGIKISEAVIKIAQPWLDDTETIENQKSVLATGVLGWNYSCFPKEKREGALASIRNIIDGRMMESEAELTGIKDLQVEIVKAMSERKNQLFPDIQCIIMKYDCVETPSGLDFNVATAPFGS